MDMRRCQTGCRGPQTPNFPSRKQMYGCTCCGKTSPSMTLLNPSLAVAVAVTMCYSLSIYTTIRCSIFLSTSVGKCMHVQRIYHSSVSKTCSNCTLQRQATLDVVEVLSVDVGSSVGRDSCRCGMTVKERDAQNARGFTKPGALI